MRAERTRRRTEVLLLVSMMLFTGGVAMPENAGAGEGDETYVPKASRAGGEARGHQMPVSSVKLYIPRSLGEGERVRAWYQYLFNQPADSGIFRDFAERAKFMIGPERDSRQARADLGRRLGHPELENIPATYIGHSAGGPSAWNKAVDPATIDRSLAVIGHHSLIFRSVTAGKVPWREQGIPEVELDPDVVRGDPRGEVPVWNLVGARDKHQPLVGWNLQVSARLSELGWKWTCVLGHGECHQGNDFEAMKLQTMWLEDVADLRIKDPVAADGTVALHDIDETQSWVGYLELLPPEWGDGGFTAWQVADAAVYPHAEAPGEGVVKFPDDRVGGYVWLPSGRVARAWLKYHRTSRLSGEDAPRLQVDIWPALTDTPDEKLGWNLFSNDWCHVYFSILNIPDFEGDFENITWEVLSPLPEGLEVRPNGRIQTDGIAAGTHKIRLRATHGERSWQADYYLGLRASENDSTLEFRAEPRADDVTSAGPVQVEWTSSLPLGLLQWHSSLDGDLGTEFGDLGTSGAINMENLTEGEHLITVLAYSAAPTTQRQAVSFFVTVAGGE
ncbi:MAG: hypothetical protein R6X33_07170 [Candidatus Brocadiia bacterium]